MSATAAVPNHAPPHYDCPFCRYVGGGSDDWVSRSHVVERTSETLTFVAPRWWLNNEGHVLVVPAVHFEHLYALPESLAAPIQRAVRRAALALRIGYRCDGTSTRQHNEPAGGQDVWHFHVHVFPRYTGDHLYGSHSRRARKEEMDHYADILRAAYAELGNE